MSNEYMVQFDFTTAHKNGKFIGRSGQLCFVTEDDLQEVNKSIADVQSLCAQYIHSQKPKWNILLINIKSITKSNE